VGDEKKRRASHVSTGFRADSFTFSTGRLQNQFCSKPRFRLARGASKRFVTQFSCEVAVLGGGLAGTGAALSLARSGVDVALFEAGTLPRHRVCGEFLSPESRQTLARLGVLPRIEAAGARAVNSARFCCDGKSARFDLGAAAGLSISRFALDPLLVGAAQNAGARVFLASKTRTLERVGDGFEFESGAQKWRAKAVIVAAGRAKSPKSARKTEDEARFCGLKAHFSGVDLEAGEVEMHLFRGGYCGLVRVEGEATNACLMTDYARLNGQAPDAFWAQLCRENPALGARFRRATRICEWQSTGNVSFGRFRPIGESGDENGAPNAVARGALCAGDAAGYIHPLTGDGMAMALRAGELAGAVARQIRGGLEIEEAARLYRAAWRREFAARLQLAARLHPFALRPRLARPILPFLRHFPALSNALVRGTRGAL